MRLLASVAVAATLACATPVEERADQSLAKPVGRLDAAGGFESHVAKMLEAYGGARRPSSLAESAFVQPDTGDMRTARTANTDIPPGEHAFLNEKTRQFFVDGHKLPLVNFDVGDSYAGLMPISKDKKETRKLFFWFFPSEDKNVKNDEITVWFNGGPGCSSLSGLVSENGPFLWQDGTFAPVKNPYSWHRLTNMLWIEQPVGTGFSQGEPSATSEYDVAAQFRGFWKNFVDAFELKGARTYMTGESYAGMYVPYIANGFLEQNDTQYFNLKGININDPVIGDDTVQFDLHSAPYETYWAHLLGYQPEQVAAIQAEYEASGQAAYNRKYFTFPPPKGPFPPPPRSSGEGKGKGKGKGKGADDRIHGMQNPCFNVYRISDQCPVPSAPLGQITSSDSNSYFQRHDVQRHIHAPVGAKWRVCGGSRDNLTSVFPHGDNTEKPAVNDVLRNIVAKTGNVMVGSGRLDSLIPSNGTLMALQNMTWADDQGFPNFPSTPLYVPDHQQPDAGPNSPYGEVGVWVKRAGLTFYDVFLAGHMVPGHVPGAGYRAMQVLLGKIKDLNSEDPLFN